MIELSHRPVWIASYPKSGNTWMRILLSNLASSRDQPEDINTLSELGGSAIHRPTLDDYCLIDSVNLTDDEVSLLRPGFTDARAEESDCPPWIKTHDAYTYLPDGTPLLGRKIRYALYLVRDPRDVAVSYAFHQNADLDRAIAYLNDPADTYPSSELHLAWRTNGWSGHAASWLDQHEVAVHLIRYEDLLADTAGVFSRALDFLEIKHDPDGVARAVRHASFGELQSQERIRGFRERPPGPQMFFRQGEAGNWRRHLDAAQIRSIELANAPMMQRLGYDLVTEEVMS